MVCNASCNNWLIDSIKTICKSADDCQTIKFVLYPQNNSYYCVAKVENLEQLAE